MLFSDSLDFLEVKENLIKNVEKIRKTDQDTQRWNLEHGNRQSAKTQEEEKQLVSS